MSLISTLCLSVRNKLVVGSHSFRARCELPEEYKMVQRWLGIITINTYNIPISTTFVCAKLIPKYPQINETLSVERSLLFA